MKNLHTFVLLSMIFSLIVIMFLFSEELHLKFHQELYLSNNKLEKAIHPKRNKALLFIDSRYQPLNQQAKESEAISKLPFVKEIPRKQKPVEKPQKKQKLEGFMYGDSLNQTLVYHK